MHGNVSLYCHSLFVVTVVIYNQIKDTQEQNNRNNSCHAKSIRSSTHYATRKNSLLRNDKAKEQLPLSF